MALDQSALLEVLEAPKAAEVDDRIRSAAITIYQALIEAELTAVIGAAPHAEGDLDVTMAVSKRSRCSTGCGTPSRRAATRGMTPVAHRRVRRDTPVGPTTGRLPPLTPGAAGDQLVS
jgi:hypothetical protein